ELRLLLDRRRGSCRSRSCAARRCCCRSRDRDTEAALEGLDQLRQLEHRHVADGFEDIVLTHRLRRHYCSPARLVLSASRAPTIAYSSPFSTPRNPAMGACSAPPNCAKSCSFDGNAASDFTCACVIGLPSTSPTLIDGFSNSLAKSVSTFAAPTGSAPASTSAVGPARNASSPPSFSCCSLSARRASVFLTTTYSTPTARRRRRRSVMWATLRPVKSVT